MYSDPTHILQEYYKKKDPFLRDKIIDSYSNLVGYIAKKLSYNRDDLDDVIQVGIIGLIKSIDRFEPTKETDFSTFATPNIIGEIKHYFRDKRNLVKIPRKIQENYSKIRGYIKESSSEKGHTPTIYQISRHLNISEEIVLECMEAGQATQVMSLDSPAYTNQSTKGYDSPALIDGLGHDNREDKALNKESLHQAMQCLKGREYEIIQLLFYQSCTQNEIADRMQLSQMHVSRLITKTIAKLKKEMLRLQATKD